MPAPRKAPSGSAVGCAGHDDHGSHLRYRSDPVFLATSGRAIVTASSSYQVVIVGAGHGGAQAAIALRQNGFEGSVAIVGDEPELPYERPPLSKEYLSGAKPFERMLIRPAGFWTDRRIAMLTGRSVVAVDPMSKTLITGDGEEIVYDRLIWATGGSARRLPAPAHDLVGVHTMRTRADADRMMSELPAVRSAVVIGGGYIGLEAAAALAKLGKRVTVLEAQDRVLARMAGEPLSRFFEQEHRRHGVEIRLETIVDGLVGRNGCVAGVRLHDGEVLAADMVVVGIGIVPAVQPLLDARAAGGNGVVVDRQCRTSLNDVFAVGDCALHSNPYAPSALIRLESVQNANDQAIVAARAIVGLAADYDATPWFWSNQYDLKLQTVGLSAGHDEIVLRGDPAARSFSVVYLRVGRVIALDCVNAVKDYVQGRLLVAGRVVADVEALRDPDVALKTLVG